MFIVLKEVMGREEQWHLFLFFIYQKLLNIIQHDYLTYFKKLRSVSHYNLLIFSSLLSLSAPRLLPGVISDTLLLDTQAR